MKSIKIKSFLFITILCFSQVTFAGGTSKQKPPQQASAQTTVPTDPTGPSFWDWLSSYFYF